MENGTNPTSLLVELSDSLANAVEAVQPAAVRVDARHRIGATGLIWRQDGMIVTADHVIQQEEDITVSLPDGRDVPAQLVGRDPGIDLALLKVEDTGLPAVQASTQEPRVGHLVLAIGRARGDTPMASMGIVSAVRGPWRTWRGGSIERIIRSDVTLYPGFSGGPLIDATGHVAGMNTSALSRGLATSLSWGFVSEVATALAEGRTMKRGYLGIVTQPVELPESLQQSAGLALPVGLLIVGVESESPAEHAGLLLGDILVSLGDRPTNDIAHLQHALGPGSAGTDLAVRIIRAGKTMDLMVTVGER